MSKEQNQWFHVETYARKVSRTTRDGGKRSTVEAIIGEQTRREGFHPHVEKPQEPQLLYGVDPSTLLEEIEARAASPRSNGSKVRSTDHVLLSGVASYPVRLDQMTDADRSHAHFWAEKTLSFLQKEWGPALKSVVAHLDENFLHLHFDVIPDDMDMKTAHRGKRAEADAKASGGRPGVAYDNAMRSYQDDYFKEVGFECGFSRLGPRRQRLSNRDWKALQSANRQEAEARAKARSELEAGQSELREARRAFVLDVKKKDADRDAYVSKSDKEKAVLQRENARLSSENEALRRDAALARQLGLAETPEPVQPAPEPEKPAKKGLPDLTF